MATTPALQGGVAHVPHRALGLVEIGHGEVSGGRITVRIAGLVRVKVMARS